MIFGGRRKFADQIKSPGRNTTKSTPTVSTSTAASSLNAETSCISSDSELEVQAQTLKSN